VQLGEHVLTPSLTLSKEHASTEPGVQSLTLHPSVIPSSPPFFSGSPSQAAVKRSAVTDKKTDNNLLSDIFKSPYIERKIY
jgi:hypothetical protein